MRMFGLIGLVLALVIVGVLVKKQFSTLASPSLPPVPGATASPGGTPGSQSRQIQQQYRQAVESAVQQPRPMPEDN